MITTHTPSPSSSNFPPPLGSEKCVTSAPPATLFPPFPLSGRYSNEKAGDNAITTRFRWCCPLPFLYLLPSPPPPTGFFFFLVHDIRTRKDGSDKGLGDKCPSYFFLSLPPPSLNKHRQRKVGHSSCCPPPPPPIIRGRHMIKDGRPTALSSLFFLIFFPSSFLSFPFFGIVGTCWWTNRGCVQKFALPMCDVVFPFSSESFLFFPPPSFLSPRPYPREVLSSGCSDAKTGFVTRFVLSFFSH